MFAPSYFSPTYFAPTYFPEVGSSTPTVTPPLVWPFRRRRLYGGTVTPVVLPYDLHDAIVAQIRLAIPTVGVNAGYAGPSAAMPYIEIYGFDEDRENMTGRPYLFSGEGQFNVYARSKLQARKIGDAIDAAITGSPISFEVGTLNYIFRTRRSWDKDVAAGPGGSTVYQDINLFHYDATGLKP